MPAQSRLVGPLLQQKQVDVLGVNLQSARFTLAVPDYMANAGVRTFADLQSHAEAFSRRVYGIEAGAPANESIKRMIAGNGYGLSGWTLVESSDAALLAQVAQAVRQRKPIVFLAWEPHIVNTRFKIHYLDGGEPYFEAQAGTASVRTVSRPGYRVACPNVAKLLSQLVFTVPLENQLIALTSGEKLTPADAARRLLRSQAELLRRWLSGVNTASGGDTSAALQALTAP